jgi:hypothetical protein
MLNIRHGHGVRERRAVICEPVLERDGRIGADRNSAGPGLAHVHIFILDYRIAYHAAERFQVPKIHIGI